MIKLKLIEAINNFGSPIGAKEDNYLHTHLESYDYFLFQRIKDINSSYKSVYFIDFVYTHYDKQYADSLVDTDEMYYIFIIICVEHIQSKVQLNIFKNRLEIDPI